MICDKETMLHYLRRAACDVNFIKADGSERKMLCTLQPHILAEVFDDPSIPKSENDDGLSDLVTVWDLEKQDWRAFYASSVLNFSPRIAID